MTNWNKHNVKTLIAEDILYIGDGYRAKNSELNQYGLPFARSSTINNGFHFDSADCFPVEHLEKVGEKVSKSGDVVFTSKGSVGRFAFVNDNIERFVYSPQLSFWRSKQHDVLLPRFLYYWMYGSEFFIQYTSVKGQTDMADYVSLRDQRNMVMTFPSLDEQRAIADILGSLDDKIEANRRQNETLEATARAIFKSWFVDFDPVHAKANGEIPIGMDAETADLFPDSFEDSELGMIPRGWRVGTLEELCEYIMSGGTPRTKVDEYWNGNIPWFSSGETRKRVIIDTEKTITESGVANSSTRLAPKWSTVIASAGQGHTRGQTSILTFDSYINQSVIALGANSSSISRMFLFFNLSGRYDELRQISDSSSSRGSLTTSILKQLKSIVPILDLVKRFDDISSSIIDQIACNENESRTLAETRDALLPKLVSGELRVGDNR